MLEWVIVHWKWMNCIVLKWCLHNVVFGLGLVCETEFHAAQAGLKITLCLGIVVIQANLALPLGNLAHRSMAGYPGPLRGNIHPLFLFFCPLSEEASLSCLPLCPLSLFSFFIFLPPCPDKLSYKSCLHVSVFHLPAVPHPLLFVTCCGSSLLH